MKQIKLLILCTLAAMAVSCNNGDKGGKDFSEEEKSLIRGEGSVMHVLTINNPEELALLQSKSRNLPEKTLLGKDFATLGEKMIKTVTDTSQDGVGRAGPQVGLLVRVVAVQRFDLPGEPFVVYPNISLEPVGDEIQLGPEGCLSVPDCRGMVPRYKNIRITYYDIASRKMVSEEVSDFTAVIFQHECDHLDGILYTDKVVLEAASGSE